MYEKDGISTSGNNPSAREERFNAVTDALSESSVSEAEVFVYPASPTAPIRVEVQVDDKVVVLETGQLARQAHGAAVLRMDKTVLLATVVSSTDAPVKADFLPLTIDYQEKFSATGRLPGGFFKREGRLSDREVLVSRLVDRALRPLFPGDYRYETQIKVNLLSGSSQVTPDSLAGTVASAALMCSDIPFEGPMAEVQVSLVDGGYVVFPTNEQLKRAELTLTVGGTLSHIVMVEGEALEVPESKVLEALRVAHEAIRKLCEAQLRLVEKAGGRKPFRQYEKPAENQELRERLWREASNRVRELFLRPTRKYERRQSLKQIKQEFVERLTAEGNQIEEALVERYWQELVAEVSRELILTEGRRVDGRTPHQIRPLYMEVDLLPATHGSALFVRGETQALATVTIGSPADVQVIDTPTLQDESKFMVHYNFPPFSTGEIKPLRPPSRREIGHGNLAYRALKGVMPPEEELTQTVRVVCDILESNGSSSMATVCASSLALMDAGVPIVRHVAGVAMGLILDEASGRYVILTDILGDEDHLGHMDFKVAGTERGITAVQMDIKVSGISAELLAEALEKARQARLYILSRMNEVIREPRPEPKEHVPRTEIIFIPKEFIGLVIGSGGSTIKNIQEESGTTIFIESVEDQGKVYITAPNKEAIEKAIKRIQAITTLPKAGEEYDGIVKEILPYGALVEFLPGRVGLLHISELAWERVDRVEDVVKVGDKIRIKLIDIDRATGKFRLSRKALLPRPETTFSHQHRKESAHRQGKPGVHARKNLPSRQQKEKEIRRSPASSKARRREETHTRTWEDLYSFRDIEEGRKGEAQ